MDDSTGRWARWLRMNLLFQVVYGSCCRSTHHRLALDALRHLRADRAEMWRDLFLSEYELYLQGSKDPDNVFKDFRNHVLHVRENFWGGAPQAAKAWYALTVEALQRGDWRHAVYDAGVLSHYFTDPFQPFHTDQTPAENNIHRAAEWSICKAYPEIFKLAATQGKEPTVEVAPGPDWLEQLIKEGATAGRAHYEALIAHYNMDNGVKDPPAGLDHTSREILSGIVTHTAVAFARVLDRAFDESGVEPPTVNLTLPTILATLKVPVNWAAGFIEDEKERNLVRAMFAELQENGEVDRTLPEDDRLIRELRDQRRRQAAPSAKVPTPVPALAPEPMEEEAEELPEEPVHTGQGPSLFESSPVERAPSIGPKTANHLLLAGIVTVGDLLAANPDQVAAAVKMRHITATVVRAWQDQANLVCRVPVLRGHDAQILVACGYRTPEAISEAEPAPMLAKVTPFVQSSEGKRVLRNGKSPDLAEVTQWIESARNSLPLQAV